jgi:hypothetical protein
MGVPFIASAQMWEGEMRASGCFGCFENDMVCSSSRREANSNLYKF